jgi:hypothetical protein
MTLRTTCRRQSKHPFWQSTPARWSSLVLVSLPGKEIRHGCWWSLCLLPTNPTVNPCISDIQTELKSNCQVLVTHVCNVSYLGRWDWEDSGSRPAWQNSLWDLISKISRAKWTGSVAQIAAYLLYRCEALSSNLSPTKKENKKRGNYTFHLENETWEIFPFQEVQSSFQSKIEGPRVPVARHQWLTPVILATRKEEIRIVVQSWSSK